MQALKDAGLTASQIDEVILVGGSTRIPAIQDKVKQIFGKEPNKGVNPERLARAASSAVTLRMCFCSTSFLCRSVSRPWVE